MVMSRQINRNVALEIVRALRPTKVGCIDGKFERSLISAQLSTRAVGTERDDLPHLKEAEPLRLAATSGFRYNEEADIYAVLVFATRLSQIKRVAAFAA